MPIRPSITLTALIASLLLTACSTTASSGPSPQYGTLDGVLAAGAPVRFVPVGTNNQGCTQYTKKPLRDDILVDTGIWYRTADDRFVLDANRCVPERASP